MVTLVAGAAPVHLVEQTPQQITNVAPGVMLVDFGRVAYGNLRLTPPANATNIVTVHFGEAFANGRINRQPPGSVRYSKTTLSLAGGKILVAAPRADKRNTEQVSPRHPAAVLTPPEWGVVTPFRWVEIENWPGDLRPENISRQAAFATSWDDSAAAFHCSDEMLNRIWELCRYSLKATTFAGVYVDGDRERISYEADGYINQLGQYYSDNDGQMVRDTFDRLFKYPHQSADWVSHMIFIAYADWLRTGDTAWLAAHYEALKPKLMLDRTRADGLIVGKDPKANDDSIVDWPPTERDHFVKLPVNTVVNAFEVRSLQLMAEMARALGKNADAADYEIKARAVNAVFQKKLFDPANGLYRDGEGTDHASFHASMFPLAFGLVPAEHFSSVTNFVFSRGMICSVYAAQYFMESLFQNGEDKLALALMTAPNDRSWRHMVESGTTISWEAWDQKYKPNQDWNHAWGAAPANLLPRFVIGAQPLAPGWTRALIRPCPGDLKFAEGKIPTPRGPVLVSWKNDGDFTLSLTLPKGMAAHLELPAREKSQGVFIGGKALAAQRNGARWILEEDVSGTVTLAVK